MDVEQEIREYLAGILHLSLGTSVNNKPWVCEVHFVYDNDLNLYFRSKEERRHSQEIAQNPNVAGNIVEQHGSSQKPRGVYFEGAAELLSEDQQIEEAFEFFADRFGFGKEVLDEARTKSGHKIYKITVTDYYLFDARGSSPSQKYHLPWKTKK